MGSVFVSLSQAADPLGFVYGALQPPVTLAAGSEFYVMDQSYAQSAFYDDMGTVLETSGAAALAGSVYGGGGKLLPGGGGVGHCYGPVNVLYG